jgi:triosephosphate isomerase
MRKPMIAGNWKLHKTVEEALDLVQALKDELTGIDDADIIVAPVFTALGKVAETLSGSNISLAAQNCYPEKTGAFTGEVSPMLLKDIGCRYVIVGHSERRQLFGESDEFINRKIHSLLEEELQPIFCIGETLEERENGRMYDILTRQIKEGLKGMEAAAMRNIVIAYEPVWAIGTGKTATDEQAAEAHAFIRSSARRLRSGDGGSHPNPVRRKRKAGERGRSHGPGRYRRRPGRRSQPEGPRFRPDCPF